MKAQDIFQIGQMAATIDLVIRTIIPWKKGTNQGDDYDRGWNDCVKESRKNALNVRNLINNIVLDESGTTISSLEKHKKGS